MEYTIQLMDSSTALNYLSYPKISIEAEEVKVKRGKRTHSRSEHEDIEVQKVELHIKNIKKVIAHGQVLDYGEFKAFYKALKENIGKDVVVTYVVTEITNPKSGWWTKNVGEIKVKVVGGDSQPKEPLWKEIYRMIRKDDQIDLSPETLREVYELVNEKTGMVTDDINVYVMEVVSTVASDLIYDAVMKMVKEGEAP